MAYEEFIGKTYAPFSVEVEKGRLRLFAKATGATDPIYTDESAARDAGYTDLPAPPSYAFSVAMDGGQPFNVLEDMRIPLTKVVHGHQGFVYHRLICAGDVIGGLQTVRNVYEKKGGALMFIETEISLTNQRGEPVCDLQSTIVVRNG